MRPNEDSLPGLLRPAGPASLTWARRLVIPLLVLSAVLVVLAAWAMPAGYSWQFHSISESAAQGQQHAWIARLSFLCHGFAVFCLCVAMRRHWPRLTYWCLLVFALSMCGASAFSHSPWVPGAHNDPVEDALHSVFASAMGFAFCAAVLARLLQRGLRASAGRLLDGFALVVATVVPLVQGSDAGVGGLLQRLMFVVAYVWLGREALRARPQVRATLAQRDAR